MGYDAADAADAADEDDAAAFVLRPEQARTVAWMAERESGGDSFFGGILADDVGSGKTFAVAGLVRSAPLWPTLIVVPTSLVWQWIAVLRKAGVRDVCVVTSRAPSIAGRSTVCGGVVIVTLGTLASTDRPPPELTERQWGRVVIDEAHCAKNPRSRTNRVLRNLRAHARWALTATPVQNCAGDLLAIARVIGLQTDDVELVRSFVHVPVLASSSEEGCSSPARLLPRLDVKVVRIPLSLDWEAGVYGELSGSAKGDDVDDDDDVEDDDACDRSGDCDDDADEHSQSSPIVSSAREFERQLRCRQAATHLSIYYRSMSVRKGADAADALEHARLADIAARMPASEVSSKVAFLASDIRACDDAHIVVFCDWLEEMRVIAAELLSEEGMRVFEFHGGLSVQERDDVLSAFRHAADDGSSSKAVLLAQVRCAACGLNLQCASRAYMMRPQWNPAVERQAIGRLHRSGQRRPVVTVLRLVATGTVDETCLRRQRGKLKVITSVMRDGGRMRAMLMPAMR